MANVEQTLELRARAAEADKKKKAEAELQALRKPAAIDLERLDRLSANPDFQWFMEERLRPFEKEAEAAALNVLSSIADRNDHAQRRHIAKQMLDCLDTERESLRQMLTAPPA